MPAEIKSIPVATLAIGEQLQTRARIQQATVNEYVDAMSAGHTFPPLTVVEDHSSGTRWLVDGYHRRLAYLNLKIKDCDAAITVGTWEDALLAAAGSNASHGLRRTNDDKRRAVLILLSHPEWSKWSDRKIAEHCQVTHPFVGMQRSLVNPTGNVTSRQGKDGKTRQVAAPEPPKSTGNVTSCHVNGTPALDPPDVAAARATGRIPSAAPVTIDEPDEQTSIENVAAELAERRAIEEDDLVDTKWLEQLPLHSILASENRRKFSRDALAYRALETARKTFAHHAGRVLRKTDHGAYAARVRAFLKIGHPKDWIRCSDVDKGGCGGIGVLRPLNLQCPKCQGRGYWIM